MIRKLIGGSAFVVIALSLAGQAAGRFDQKLPSDKLVTHVLNRLTFGPRPGDQEQVRRLGVAKWIQQQLHPEAIAESPVLETRLTTIATWSMPTWQVLEKYSGINPILNMRLPSANALASLQPVQSTRIMNGSLEDRKTALESLDPSVRRLVLVAAPARVLEGLPEEWVTEASDARKAEQADRQQAIRKAMPPLMDLLTPDQIRIVQRGAPGEKLALINSFDEEKRRKVVRALPMQAVADLPQLRREAMAAAQPQQFVNMELVDRKLTRAIYSNRQLEEVLVDFWMNHFNVFNGKGQDRVLLTSYERDAIRPYVFGHFKDMLLATARHPAMLFYLDNWQSQAPREDIPLPPGARRPGLNENYGRELMELHTLGVDGGYTQNDVIAVARAFTGWSIYDPQRFAEFQFNPAFHDRKEKVVLGHTIPAMGAEGDGLAVIDILAHHPSTAHFISKKLAQRFVADTPPPALVDRMAATFTRTDGDLRAVLETLFSSVEFQSEGAWEAKLKSPLEMVVSAVRATSAEVTDTFAIAQRIADLGEPLYGKLEPTGYPNTGDAWANTASILGRINFSSALTGKQIPGVTVDLARFDGKPPAAVARDVLGTTPSASTLAAIDRGGQDGPSTPDAIVALVLSSPDFQRR
jgi:uncharacterized protein (DUF1800 family)